MKGWILPLTPTQFLQKSNGIALFEVNFLKRLLLIDYFTYNLHKPIFSLNLQLNTKMRN